MHAKLIIGIETCSEKQVKIWYVIVLFISVVWSSEFWVWNSDNQFCVAAHSLKMLLVGPRPFLGQHILSHTGGAQNSSFGLLRLEAGENVWITKFSKPNIRMWEPLLLSALCNFTWKNQMTAPAKATFGLKLKWPHNKNCWQPQGDRYVKTRKQI